VVNNRKRDVVIVTVFGRAYEIGHLLPNIFQPIVKSRSAYLYRTASGGIQTQCPSSTYKMGGLPGLRWKVKTHEITPNPKLARVERIRKLRQETLVCTEQGD